MSFHFCLPERKCMDKKEGRHSVRIIVRMTENEYEKFDALYKKAQEKSDGLRKSDFMRSQLTYENSERQLKEIMNELRKLRTEFHQGLLRLTMYNDKDSAEHMKELLTQADEKIDEIKIRLEAIDGDNNS